MKQVKKFLTILFFLFMVIACVNKEAIEPVMDENPNKNEEDKVVKALPNLESREKIIDYLTGDWVYNYYYRGDVIAKMSIDKDLNVELSFTNTYSQAPKGEFNGKISFDWAYVDEDAAPDMIILNLEGTDLNGGEFLFLHRTIYEGKRVMSWFHFGNANSIFDVENQNGEYLEAQVEIMFEQVTNEKAPNTLRKNDAFHAVVWGLKSDEKSLWLDDVLWQGLDDNYAKDYPYRMTIYQNDVAESNLYKINQEKVAEVLGDEMPIGEVYFIETNQDGEIISLIDAGRKDWLDLSDKDDKGIEGKIMDIIYSCEEIVEYLNLGMTIQFEEGYVVVDDKELYEVVLGTKHEDGHFVREIFYVVNINTGEVFEYDVINDEWIQLAKG